MRICFISNLYPPYGRGGAERVVEQEAKALKALGHDVLVITGEPVREDGSIDPRMTEEDGIRVYRYYPLNLFFYGEIGRHGVLARLLWHLWDLRNRSSARVVRGVLKRERPDIVHTHNLKGLGFGIPRVIRKLGLRHVHTLHDVQLAVPSGLIVKGGERAFGVADPFSRAFAGAVRMLFGSPDLVVSPSRFLLRFYEERGFFPQSEKILLPNPAPSIRPVARVPQIETRFLFFGQVERHKGILTLIESFRRLVKERPKIRLDIVGSGSAGEEARRAVGDEARIVFYGKRIPAQFAETFAKIDYVVLPSLCYENAPNVVLESFAYGVPVIAAEIGGAAELVRPGENGLVFEAGNVKALVSAMKRACDEKGAWPGRSNAARRSAELLTVDRHVGRLLGLYTNRDAALSHRGPVVPVRYQPNFARVKKRPTSERVGLAPEFERGVELVAE